MVNAAFCLENREEIDSSFEITLLTPAQRWLFAYFPSRFEWFDSLSFTLTSSISVERVEKTIQDLVKRHCGLRTTFVQEGTEWKQKIHKECPSHLLKAVLIESQMQLTKPLEDIKLDVCKSFQLDQLPLFKVLIVSTSNTSFTLHILFHHIIVDYVSLMTFIKEFYSLYYNKNVLPSVPASNLLYAREIKILSCSMAHKRSINEYLTTETVNWLGISKENKRPSKELNSVRLEQTISLEDSELLLRFGKSRFKKRSLHPILVAPLYRAIQKISHQTSVSISHKLHGRELKPNDIRFFSTIGNFAINVPIRSEVFSNETWDTLIDRLDQALHEDPTRHLCYDLIGPSLPSESYPDHFIAPVRFNFMGTMSFFTPPFLQIDFRKFAQRVKVADQILTTYIEFFLYFSEKKLWIEVVSDSSLIPAPSLQMLIDHYIEGLNQMITSIKKDKFL